MPVMMLPFKSLLFVFIPLLFGMATPRSAVAQDIVGVTLASVEGKPKIGVILDNPTPLPVWVEVYLGASDPARCGSGRNELAAGQKMMVLCSVEQVVAKTDYPVTAVFSSDKEAMNPLVTKTRKGRFGKQDVKWMYAQLEQQP